MNIGGPVATFQNSTFVLNASTEQILEIDDQTDLATPFAGSGATGFSGDGGPAINASFRLTPGNSDGLATDSDGDVIIDDTANDRLRFIAASDCSSSCPYGLPETTAGDIYTIAGDGQAGVAGDGGLATAAQIDDPNSLSIDADGDVIFSSQNLLEALPSHEAPNVRLVASQSCSSACPFGLPAMTAGYIYLLGGTGTYGHTGDGGPAVDAEFTINSGNTAVDSRGDVVVDDDGNEALRLIAAYSCSSSCPYGLGTMTAGDVYAIAGGTVGTPVNGQSALGAPLYGPETIAIDPSGDIFLRSDNTLTSRADLYMISGSNCTSNCPFGLASTVTGAIYDLPNADLALANQDSGPAISPNGDLIIQAVTDPSIGVPQDVLFARNSCTSSCLFGLPQLTPGGNYVVAGDRSGQISGTVTYDSVGALNTCVYAKSQATGAETMSMPESDGAYIIRGLAPGKYVVKFDPTCEPYEQYAPQWYNGTSSGSPGPAGATAVTVGTSDVTGISAQLAPGASITGTVTASGSAVADVCVTAYADDPSDGGDFLTASTTTAVDGTYTLSRLPEDTFLVRFDPTCQGAYLLDSSLASKLDIAWYNGPAAGESGSDDPAGGESKDDATSITAIASSSGPATGINAGLAPGTSVEGTISAPGTSDTAGVCVSLLNPGSGEVLAETFTSGAGAYEFTYLPAGTFEVVADPTCGGTLSSEFGATVIPAFSALISQSFVENATLPMTSSGPSITTDALTPATQGSPYAFGLSASGGIAPYSWVWNGLPTGLSINPQTGVISGTPQTSGTFSVSVGAIDHSSPPGEGTGTLTLVVNAATTTTTLPPTTTTTYPSPPTTTTTIPSSPTTTTTIPSLPTTTTTPSSPTTTTVPSPATTTSITPSVTTTTTTPSSPTTAVVPEATTTTTTPPLTSRTQPSISLVSTTASRVTNGVIKEEFRCEVAACSGTARLSETLSVRVHRGTRVLTVLKTEVVGSTHFSIKNRQKATEVIRLSADGIHALNLAGRIHFDLLISVIGGRSTENVISVTNGLT
jgi:hypothetical protein